MLQTQARSTGRFQLNKKDLPIYADIEEDQ